MKTLSFRFALALTTGMAAAVSSYGQTESVTATISGVAVSGGYDYTITLENTGANSLNGFWYGWVPGQFNLPSAPSLAANSLGWVNDPDGDSVIWENSSGTALAPDSSATFTFFDSANPTAMTTSPAGQSVAYVSAGSIGDNPGISGDSTAVFSPSLVPAPEPSSLGLMLVGLFVAAGSSRLWSARRNLRRVA